MATGPAHHVSGEAAVRVGLGPAGALVLFGYSVDGVDIEFNEHVVPVHDDRYGTEIPADEQDMGIDGYINADIVWWDEAVRLLIAQKAWLSGVEGQALGMGNLFNAGAGAVPFAAPFTYRLVVDVPVVSPTIELPWNYLHARLATQPSRIKVGTKHSIWRHRWYWKLVVGTATTTNNGVAMNRVNT